MALEREGSLIWRTSALYSRPLVFRGPGRRSGTIAIELSSSIPIEASARRVSPDPIL